MDMEATELLFRVLSRSLLQAAGASLEQTPGDLLRNAEQDCAGAEAAGLEDHANCPIEMIGAVETVGAAHIFAAVAGVDIGLAGCGIGGVIGAGKLVVLGLGNASQRDAQPAESADIFTPQIGFQVRVE